MTSPLYPLAAPIPQDLKEPDLPFYFFPVLQVWTKRQKETVDRRTKNGNVEPC